MLKRLYCLKTATSLALIVLAFAMPATAQLGSGVVFVDAENGRNDAERSGSANQPYATLTYALQRLENASTSKPWTLRLQAGTYAAPAEIFPISIHTGMQLLGDDGPESVIISGAGNTDKNVPLLSASGATGVTISGITFRDNARTGGTNRGGALELNDFGGAIHNCKFISNSTQVAGGAIWVDLAEGTSLDISSTEFRQNSASGFGRALRSGGAIHVQGDLRGGWSECQFVENFVYCDPGVVGSAELFAAGGALYVAGDLLMDTLADSGFSDNFADSDGNGDSGGAIHVQGDAETSIENATFESNQARGSYGGGGAISVQGSLGASSQSRIVSSNFRENRAPFEGGAVRVGDSARLDLTGSVFADNRLGSSGRKLMAGGAIFIHADYSGSITSCGFRNNFLFNDPGVVGFDTPDFAAGGAIYIGGDASGGSISDTEMVGNSTDADGNATAGGAMMIAGNMEWDVRGSRFVGNNAKGLGSLGGAIYVGGAFSSGGFFESALVENRSGGAGGAVLVEGLWQGEISNAVVLRNTGTRYVHAASGYSLGGAIGVAAAFQGDIRHCIFSDNALSGSHSSVAVGGALAILGTYRGEVVQNVFTANSVSTVGSSWSEGGAIAFKSLVQPQTHIHNNVFSKNSANYGGGLSFGADGGAEPRIYNNHFLYNQTPGREFGGAAIFTRQNLFIFNNTIFGEAADAAAIALWNPSVGSEIWNNAFLNLETAVHFNSATLLNSVVLAHNNFYTTNVLVRDEEAFFADADTLAALDGPRFYGNHLGAPPYYGEGDLRTDNASRQGAWELDAFYDAAEDVTVFTDSDQNWTPDSLRGMFLNLSQSATSRNLREHFLIAGNTATQVFVRGNLAPDFEGLTQANRGANGSLYVIDDYRMASRSPNIDGGARVELFINAVRTDITPDVDYEGDERPRNCGIDIGADEGLRPIPTELTLLGSAAMCIPVGGTFVEPGVEATGLVGSQELDIAVLVVRTGSVNTAVPGVYTLTYTLDFCTGTVLARTRTVEVSLTGCTEPTGPIANAGPDRTYTVPSGATTVRVTLDGSASSASTGIASYKWTGLDDAPDPADVVSPQVDLAPGVYSFGLVVSDTRGVLAADNVIITVREPAADEPVANPGPNRTVEVPSGAETAPVILDGSGSTASPGAEIVSYEWRGVGGAPDPADVRSPLLNLGPGTYTFELTITDSLGNSASSTVTIIVPETAKTALLGCSAGSGSRTAATGDVAVFAGLLSLLLLARVRRTAK